MSIANLSDQAALDLAFPLVGALISTMEADDAATARQALKGLDVAAVAVFNARQPGADYVPDHHAGEYRPALILERSAAVAEALLARLRLIVEQRPNEPAGIEAAKLIAILEEPLGAALAWAHAGETRQ